MNQRGIVYTFYSFKGGVGRSMALANVAALLAKWGNKVLVIDWDLEAPGLEKYFYNNTSTLSDSRKEKPGVLDLITTFARDEYLDWRECLLQASSFSEGYPISILTAGRDSDEYIPNLHGIKWDFLFEEKGFGNYLEKLREEWLTEFEFVLIDSRTGITDIGGICTIHLPDVLVLFFTANDQSLKGVIDVMHRARKRHETLPFDRVKLVGVPIPSRFENFTEYELATKWKEIFAAELAEIYADWLPDQTSPRDVLEKLFIPYFPFWSFGENLPVVKEGATDPRSLGFAYELLARLLKNRLNWSEALQSDVVISNEAAPDVIDKEAERVYKSLSPREQELAEKIFKRLVHVSADGEHSTARMPRSDFDDVEARRVIDAFVKARLLRIIKPNKKIRLRSAQVVAQDSLIQNWQRLQQWIMDDLEFLIWRQDLHSRAVEWEQNGAEKELLLSGSSLRRAEHFLGKRREDLTVQEIFYITRSSEEFRQHRFQERRQLIYAFTPSIVIIAVLSVILFYFYQQTDNLRSQQQQQLELLKEQQMRYEMQINELRKERENTEQKLEDTQKRLDALLNSLVSPRRQT